MRSRRLPRAVDLPTLAAFARAYLHEDVSAEHGSGLEAATAYARDASADEQRQLVDDLERLARALDGKPVNQLTHFFTQELRASWTPATVADLRALISRIESIDSRQRD